eukprot:3141560-Amphidinium_carterae.1
MNKTNQEQRGNKASPRRCDKVLTSLWMDVCKTINKEKQAEVKGKLEGKRAQISDKKRPQHFIRPGRPSKTFKHA